MDTVGGQICLKKPIQIWMKLINKDCTLNGIIDLEYGPLHDILCKDDSET